MKSSVELWLLLVVLAFGISICQAGAANLIYNGSFELPDVAPGSVADPQAPWMRSMDPDQICVWDVADADLPNLYNGPLPNGRQILRITDYSGGYAAVDQRVGVLENASYTISVRVGDRKDKYSGGYTIMLYVPDLGSVGSVWSTDAGAPQTVDGGWITVSFTTDPTAYDSSWIGQPLILRVGCWGDVANGIESQFDDVQVTKGPLVPDLVINRSFEAPDIASGSQAYPEVPWVRAVDPDNIYIWDIADADLPNKYNDPLPDGRQILRISDYNGNYAAVDQTIGILQSDVPYYVSVKVGDRKDKSSGGYAITLYVPGYGTIGRMWHTDYGAPQTVDGGWITVSFETDPATYNSNWIGQPLVLRVGCWGDVSNGVESQFDDIHAIPEYTAAPIPLIDLDAFHGAIGGLSEWQNDGKLGGTYPYMVANGGSSTPPSWTWEPVGYCSTVGPAWGYQPATSSTPAITGIEDFTLDLWLNRQGSATGSEHQIFGLHNSNDNTAPIYLHLERGSDTTSVDLYLASTWVDDLVQLPQGQWCQIALTFSDTTNTLKAYKNGQLAATRTASVDLDPSMDRRRLSVFKSNSDEPDNRRFNGYISRVRLYSQELTGVQIASNYREGNTNNEEKLALELMDPAVFPDAQYGMSVESVVANGNVVTVTTTGTQFDVDKANSKVVCYQRLGLARKTATITLPSGCLSAATIISRTTGAVVLDSSAARLRINGDSLIMFQSKQVGSVTSTVHFNAGSHWVYGSNRLILDNYGGIAVLPMGKPCPRGTEAQPCNPSEYYTSSVSLDANQVMWVSVCPPRSFEWQDSFNNKYFYFWTDDPDAIYPDDSGLYNHLVVENVGNIYLLGSDVAGWNNWQINYEPRDWDELQRVIDTCHSYGAMTSVYTSPTYFVRGTPLDRDAEDLTAVGGWPSGENLALQLGEMYKVINDYGVDGVYCDTPYCESVVQSYRWAREMRRLAGDGARLCLHSTWHAPGTNLHVYCPTIESYMDEQYRGEDVPIHTLDGYNRFVLSGYYISSAISIACVNAVPQQDRTQAFVDTMLDINGRFMYDLGGDLVHNYYWPQLNNDLITRVDDVMADRNAAIVPPQGAPPGPPP